MKSEITVLYDKEIVLNGERAIFLKEWFLLIIFYPFVIGGLLFEAYETNSKGATNFLAIILIILFVYSFIHSYYFRPIKTADFWDKTGLKTAIFRFSDKEIIFEATSYKYNIEWNQIIKFWFTKDFLVLRTKQGWYQSIPIGEFGKQLIFDIRLKLKNS